MANGGHTVKAFDEELNQIRATICEMGGLAEAAIRESMQALVQRDQAGAARVIERDSRIDALETEAERMAVQIIALRAPMADDLRDVVAALKIAGVVERIGDYAKNIAKRVASVEDSKIRPISLLPEMSRITIEMVHQYSCLRHPRCRQSGARCERDSAVDDFYNSIFRALLTHMMENPHNITPATHLLFVAKISSGSAIMRPILPRWSIRRTGHRLADRAKGRTSPRSERVILAKVQEKRASCWSRMIPLWSNC